MDTHALLTASIARALGADALERANVIAWHTIVITLALGAMFAALFLTFGYEFYEGDA